jgi:hypothetical protein
MMIKEIEKKNSGDIMLVFEPHGLIKTWPFYISKNIKLLKYVGIKGIT